jgi:hypothetical protein
MMITRLVLGTELTDWHRLVRSTGDEGKLPVTYTAKNNIYSPLPIAKETNYKSSWPWVDATALRNGGAALVNSGATKDVISQITREPVNTGRR